MGNPILYERWGRGINQGVAQLLVEGSLVLLGVQVGSSHVGLLPGNEAFDRQEDHFGNPLLAVAGEHGHPAYLPDHFGSLAIGSLNGYEV